MLTIYRASAGTGKTHTLTGEYLQLLFAGTDVHSRILSVTFTNKATEEMKNRIIQELYLLSSNRPSGYVAQLAARYNRTETQIRRQANRILIRILHDYAAFNISTIDHFFQQTMRAFIREIGLQGNYRVEMDAGLVLSESIDNLLAELDQKEHADLLGWLLRFSEDKVERGENWDLRNEIKALGYELFKEKYKACSREISRDVEDKQAFAQYKDTLYALIRSTETEAKQIGEEGLAILDRHHLQPADFKGGARSPILLFGQLAKGHMKEPSATFKKLAGDVEACYTKTTPPAVRQAIEQAFRNGLDDCIQRTIRFFDSLAPYYTAREVTRFYYTLGILSDISRQIRLWCEEKNRMLIADTTELLAKIIDGSEIPFIYEKTGTRIDHYMIDEFQDTSEMQWRNFRPLIKESMAYRRANLIVGDVKQSIYRFRNSDWTLLDEQVRQDFPAGETTEMTLAENWRSHRLIVEFNNTFFTVAPALLQQTYNQGLEESTLSRERRAVYASRIISAYDKSFQHVSPPFRSKDGHVRVEFLPDKEDVSWKEEAMNRLPGLIERLQQNGYELRDIAVLVRTRAEGMMVAETLLACKESRAGSAFNYDIISEDALMIDRSPAVRFMIRMLTSLNRPDDSVAAQMARMAYAVMSRKENCFYRDMETAFPDETIRELRRLSHRSFYETAEGIYRLFESGFPESEQVFILAFLDLAAGYAEKEPGDTEQFLQWWKETGRESKIATPDTQNAIRILTIHKSKGLGFKVVILPFADWEIDQKSGSILWCRPQTAPFDRLHLAPVSYSKDLNKTLFAEDYYHEKLHACIDNLNALYVAFTRAKEELIIFTPDAEVKRAKPVSRLIRESIQTGMESSVTREGETLRPFAGGFRAEEGVFEWGEWWHPAEDRHAAAEEIPMRRIPSISPDERLHLRLHRRGGFLDDRQRRYGILMHDLLSRIQTVAGIRTAVEEKESAGEIDRQESAVLAERLESLLSRADVSRWFDGSMHVMNEVEILSGDGKSHRPDRVMIDGEQIVVVDYKFGEQKDMRHHRQIKRYLALVGQMGYPQVKGYLWYVELNEIETVHAG
jgi:ATP-dependent exoDNAse (exonuclease V) beta subunit